MLFLFICKYESHLHGNFEELQSVENEPLVDYNRTHRLSASLGWVWQVLFQKCLMGGCEEWVVLLKDGL